MTNLVYLPSLQGSETCETNEDWFSCVTFWWDDALTRPVDLTGITFTKTVRPAVGDVNVTFQGSTTDGSLTLLSAGFVASVVAGGTGWLLNDQFVLAGGTFTTSITMKVTGVSAGAVTAAQIVQMGNYSVLPLNPVLTQAVSGGGSGLTLNLTFVKNALCTTVLKIDIPKTLVAGTYVHEIRGSDEFDAFVVVSGDLTVTQGVVLP